MTARQKLDALRNARVARGHLWTARQHYAVSAKLRELYRLAGREGQ